MKKQKHHIGNIKLKDAPDREGWIGQDRIYCHICGMDLFYSGLRMHIASYAMREPFYKQIGVIKKASHFDFYIKNTINVRFKRVWKI